MRANPAQLSLLLEGDLNELQLEIINAVVRMAKLMGLPKSVGEIYGLLYSSPEALPMDRIIELLKISLSSASMGLKTLRSLRAVKVAYIPGERRDFYTAEESFRKIISNFLKEEVSPHLESGKERLDIMSELLADVSDEEKSFYSSRVDRLQQLSKAANKLLPLVSHIIKI